MNAVEEQDKIEVPSIEAILEHAWPTLLMLVRELVLAGRIQTATIAKEVLRLTILVELTWRARTLSMAVSMLQDMNHDSSAISLSSLHGSSSAASQIP